MDMDKFKESCRRSEKQRQAEWQEREDLANELLNLLKGKGKTINDLTDALERAKNKLNESVRGSVFTGLLDQKNEQKDSETS